MQEFHFNWLVNRLFMDIKEQLENEENTSSNGEPQAWVSLSNGRSIEVTLEKDMLSEEKQFYSVCLHCNEAEFDNDDYKVSLGVIDRYCTDKADVAEVRDLLENAVRCNEKYPVAEHNYDIGFGYKGNGITVWNRLQEEYGDYKTIAHISPERVVTYYAKNIPDGVKQKIEDYAAKANPTISATQDQLVFFVPPRDSKEGSLDSLIGAVHVENNKTSEQSINKAQEHVEHEI